MTNPDNIVRVRARNGGRASVYEANGWAQAYTSGLLEGNGVIQNTVADMNVLVGGSSAKPDVVLAENPAGYKIALDLVGQQAIAITAPATNKRISAIVAYTDDLSLQSTEDAVTGSPASCGLIVVNGTAGANPSAPTDSQITQPPGRLLPHSWHQKVQISQAKGIGTSIQFMSIEISVPNV